MQSAGAKFGVFKYYMQSFLCDLFKAPVRSAGEDLKQFKHARQNLGVLSIQTFLAPLRLSQCVKAYGQMASAAHSNASWSQHACGDDCCTNGTGLVAAVASSIHAVDALGAWHIAHMLAYRLVKQRGW